MGEENETPISKYVGHKHSLKLQVEGIIKGVEGFDLCSSKDEGKRARKNERERPTNLLLLEGWNSRFLKCGNFPKLQTSPSILSLIQIGINGVF